MKENLRPTRQIRQRTTSALKKYNVKHQSIVNYKRIPTL